MAKFFDPLLDRFLDAVLAPGTGIDDPPNNPVVGAIGAKSPVARDAPNKEDGGAPNKEVVGGTPNNVVGAGNEGRAGLVGIFETPLFCLVTFVIFFCF